MADILTLHEVCVCDERRTSKAVAVYSKCVHTSLMAQRARVVPSATSAMVITLYSATDD